MKKILVFMLCAIFLAGIACTVQASNETVIVLSLAGDVKITPFGAKKPVECQPGMILKEGTRIITGEESYIEIAFDRGRNNKVKIKADSEAMIKLDGEDKIELIDGEALTLLRDLRKGQTFRVRTPCAVCGARGTGWNTGTDGNVTNIASFEDRVFVRGINRDGSVMEDEYWVNEGFERDVTRFERPGEEREMPASRFSGMREDAGLDRSGTMNRGTEMMNDIESDENMRERQIDGIQERKNDDLISSDLNDDAKRDNSSGDDSDGGGYSISE